MVELFSFLTDLFGSFQQVEHLEDFLLTLVPLYYDCSFVGVILVNPSFFSVQTILNPAPAIPLDKEFFAFTDVICPNESEVSTNKCDSTTHICLDCISKEVDNKPELHTTVEI